MRRRWFGLALGALWCAAGCSNPPASAAQVSLSRSGDVAFACFETAADKPERVLPLACCHTRGDEEPPTGDCGERPERHLLVTQTARGEIATIRFGDSSRRAVLDSDRSIPGFTFVDAGELPRALVVPPNLPGDPQAGPAWTYVASRVPNDDLPGAEPDAGLADDGGVVAEQGTRWAVSAIPTCRFREGPSCGPSVGGAPTRVALPGPPVDMVLVGEALVVAIQSGQLVQVALGDADASSPFGPVARTVAVDLPALASAQAPVAEAELDPYALVCGAPYAGHARLPLELPLHPPSGPGDRAQPSRLVVDESAGVVLVGDLAQPVIHAYRVAAGALEAVGTLLTGARVRDLAVTPEVPRSVAAVRYGVELGAGASASADGLPSLAEGDAPGRFSEDSVRYLYAVDDADGSVLVMEYSAGEAAVSGRVLRPPGATRWADRLQLEGVAEGLVVLDNRPAGSAPERERSCEQVRAAQSAAGESSADGRLDVGSEVVRGVVLAVMMANGQLRLIDVHDPDVLCRAESVCQRPCPPGEACPAAASTEPVGEALPLALRRHSPRLLTNPLPEVTLTKSDEFGPLGCGEGYYPAAQGAAPQGGGAPPTLLCLNADPWLTVGGSYGATYQGRLGGTFRARFADDLTLQVAAGVDLCVTGVTAADAVMFQTTTDPPCVELTEGRSDPYGIERVAASEVTLQLLPEEPAGGPPDGGGPDGASAEPPKARPAEVLAALRAKCAPHEVEFFFAARERYLMSDYPIATGAAGEDGQCVGFAGYDARFDRRTRLDQDLEQADGGDMGEMPVAVVSTVQAQFRPAAPAESGSEPAETRNTFRVAPAPTHMVLSFAQAGVPVSPSRLRFLRGTRELFVVDAGSTGVTRFAFEPRLSSAPISFR